MPFIDSSFRDIADEDYLAARIAYRYDLLQPFLWSSLQALEKYLKAILLYHRCDTRDLRHDVSKGFQRVKGGLGPPAIFPPDIQLFIDYINEEGPNRYFGYPGELKEVSLIGLDRTVWYLRRYCFTTKPGDEFAAVVAALGDDPLEYRLRFSIPGGRLEQILAKKNDKRQHLAWKNFWFGSRRRRRIKAYPNRFAWKKPVHIDRPDVYCALKDLVMFETPVKDYFERGFAKKP